MARFAVKLWLFVLLQILTLATADPSPKKGGGGGSSDGSGSGSGSGDGSTGGGSSSPSGTRHVEVSGDKWPYRWAGSYYNGTMSFEVSIESWPGCSEGSRKGIRTTMDGILMLGPGNQTGTFDAVDPNFVLMGWDAGKIPTNNWTDGTYWQSGGPGGVRWFSTDVKLMLSRWVSIWQSSSSIKDPYDLGWQVKSKPAAVNGSNLFPINGTFSGSSTTFSTQDNSEDNWMKITTLLCNNQTTIDTFTMQPWTHASAIQDWPSTQNTTFNGSFSETEASIIWSGNYWGGFDSIDYGVPYAKSGYPQGYFRIVFDGKADDSQSDQLIARTEDALGYYHSAGTPTWNKKFDRTQNEPSANTFYINGSIKPTIFGFWPILISLVLLAWIL